MLCGLFPTLFTLTAFLDARLLVADVLLPFPDRRRKNCARDMLLASSRIMASTLTGGIVQRWCWSGTAWTGDSEDGGGGGVGDCVHEEFILSLPHISSVHDTWFIRRGRHTCSAYLMTSICTTQAGSIDGG